MPKCPVFFVYAWIVIKSLGPYEAQENAPPVRPEGHFNFLGVGHVPKCPTVLVVVTSRNAPQVIGASCQFVGVATIMALVTVALRLISEAAATNG